MRKESLKMKEKKKKKQNLDQLLGNVTHSKILRELT